MLTRLRISDFAIIDFLDLTFSSGLITFTGETGAGKSIIIDAVEAILGGRVDLTMIRTGASRADLEAEFRLSGSIREPILSILEREALLDEQDDFVILGREIREEGRHIARVNGRNVNLAILKEIGDFLVDVHGQSEHLSLLRVSSHVRLLDAFADLGDTYDNYHATYQKLRQVRQELKTLRQEERDTARRVDLLQFQADEIEAANLSPNEDEDLKNERTRLANAESLATAAQEALYSIDEGEPDSQAAIDRFGQALEALTHLSKIDETKKDLQVRAQEIFENLADLALELRNYIEGMEHNPDRLEEVEERLDLIQSLKRKYGATIEEVLAFGIRASDELESIANAEARIAVLEKEEGNLLARLGNQGEKLFRVRKKAADDLSNSIEMQLQDLRMEQAQFGVEFQRRPDPDGVRTDNGDNVAFGPLGLETVQFLVAPNPGEGLKPLAKIASGGEMSRLMLAMKNVLAQADTTPTLIFDEIDQGIGGRIGAVVGEKLWRLSAQHQVLCITHLPQLAAFGGQHYRVLKQVQNGRTLTLVETLEGEPRLEELAQMLGDVSEGTLQSARELMESASQVRDRQVA
jgi:DNA repair protein RecN (Recombination protein N)